MFCLPTLNKTQLVNMLFLKLVSIERLKMSNKDDSVKGDILRQRNLKNKITCIIKCSFVQCCVFNSNLHFYLTFSANESILPFQNVNSLFFHHFFEH